MLKKKGKKKLLKMDLIFFLVLIACIKTKVLNGVSRGMAARPNLKL